MELVFSELQWVVAEAVVEEVVVALLNVDLSLDMVVGLMVDIIVVDIIVVDIAVVDITMVMRIGNNFLVRVVVMKK